MKKKSALLFVLALVALVLAFGPMPGVAEETDTSVDVLETAEPVEDISVSVAGMTVFVDEETGEFRLPTAEEAAVLSAAVQRMFGPVAAETQSFRPATFAGGAVGVDLGVSQLAFSVATINADGTVEHDCARTADDAQAHTHGHLAPEEEK